jgi:PKD repeat protein
VYDLTYNYQLKGTKCVQEDPFKIFIRPLPKPALAVTDSICKGVPVSFSNRSSGAVKYRWQIGEESIYETEKISHTFLDTGIYQVQLRAINIFGCADVANQSVYVAGPPIVNFEKDTSQGCAVLPITLNNKTIGYRSARYLWDFGNGDALSRLEQPGTIYFKQGLVDTTYYINLKATNYCGEDETVDSVLVFPKPLTDLRINQRFSCTPSRVVFNNLSKGLPERYEWYLDGKLISTDSIAPERVLRAPGPGNAVYKVSLLAFNNCGADTATKLVTVKPDSIRAFFEVDKTEGCEPFKVQFKNTSSIDSLIVYNWYFQQDNLTSNSKDTSVTFFSKKDTVTQYQVTLVANNNCSENTFSTVLKVFPSPKVEMEAVDAACAREEVRFSSPTQGLNGYVWKFGDGKTSRETSPLHRYALPGEYNIQLTAFSVRNGCPGENTRKILIRPLPSPSLQAGPTFGCPPLKVSVQNTTLGKERYFYRWDYGDGGSAVGVDPGSHIYEASGTYPITLRAVDQYGCGNDTVFSGIRIFPQPEAIFVENPIEKCGTPQRVCLDNQSKNADGYIWDFGNQSPFSDLRQPCVTYTGIGTYKIRLIARNSFLCGDTLERSYTVYGKPVADFEVDKATLCSEARFSMKNLSRNADYFRWNLSSGRTDTINSPVFILSSPGKYALSLVAGNPSGCRDTLFRKDWLTVLPSPKAGMRIEQDIAAPPSTFNFWDASSRDVVKFGWDLSDGVISTEKNTSRRFISRFDREIRHWVENAEGCSDTIRQFLDLDTLGGLFIPNVLEPEHPELEKRLFIPKGIGLRSFHLAIYSRSGQLLWETTELDKEGSPVQSWNGIFLSQEMPAGAYVWKVHEARFLDGSFWGGMKDEKGRLQKSGIVYLLR